MLRPELNAVAADLSDFVILHASAELSMLGNLVFLDRHGAIRTARVRPVTALGRLLAKMRLLVLLVRATFPALAPPRISSIRFPMCFGYPMWTRYEHLINSLSPRHASQRVVDAKYKLLHFLFHIFILVSRSNTISKGVTISLWRKIDVKNGTT